MDGTKSIRAFLCNTSCIWVQRRADSQGDPFWLHTDWPVVTLASVDWLCGVLLLRTGWLIATWRNESQYADEKVGTVPSNVDIEVINLSALTTPCESPGASVPRDHPLGGLGYMRFWQREALYFIVHNMMGSHNWNCWALHWRWVFLGLLNVCCCGSLLALSARVVFSPSNLVSLFHIPFAYSAFVYTERNWLIWVQPLPHLICHLVKKELFLLE